MSGPKVIPEGCGAPSDPVPTLKFGICAQTAEVEPRAGAKRWTLLITAINKEESANHHQEMAKGLFIIAAICKDICETSRKK